MRNILLTLILSSCAALQAGEAETVLMSTPEFSVTTREVDYYLKHLSRSSGVAVANFSSARVSQAIIELYGLKTLNLEAEKAGMLTNPDEVEWLEDHLLTTERIKKYTLTNVEAGVAEIDWEQEARQYYRANVSEFMTSDRVKLQTLLIRTNSRGVMEAIDITRSLVEDNMPADEFANLIKEHTEDEVAKANNGEMTISRGDTVPVFESAAFALEKEGQITGPIVSQFGVHTIQLLERLPPQKIPFREVRDQIIGEIQVAARKEIRDSLVLTARSSEPEGYFIDDKAIDAYMKFMGFEPLPSVAP